MALVEDRLPETENTAGTAFQVEQRGIDYIPRSERWAKPKDLFGMWAGASFQIEYFVYGVILQAFFGLDFDQVIFVTIVGNLSFLILGFTSLQGPNAGTTSMTINRASYGPLGSRVIALFNWVTQVGFETEGLILVVYGAEVLAIKAGFLPGTPAKIIFLLAGIAVQLTLPIFGHATMVKTLRVLTLPFIILFAVLAGLTLGKVHVDFSHHGGDWRMVMVGLAFTIALAGLGWSENGNDYSRYVSPDAKKSAIVGWVFLGTAIPEILVMLLGAAVGSYASTIATNANPFAAFESSHIVATGFVVPLIIVSMVQLFAINSLDLYSSGVTLQALGLNVKRWQAVLVDTAVSGGLTAYAIFSSSFHSLLVDFADCVICWVAPWMAIYLVDWALRRFRYVPSELQKTDRTSLYWRKSGIHWPAVIAQTVGTVIAVESVSQVFFVGQISRWMGANHIGIYPDFSIFFGVFVGGLLYFVLAGASVKREADRQEEILATQPVE